MESWIENYLEPDLLAKKNYHIDQFPARYKLDQNEAPCDWPAPLKERILAKIAAKGWNCYPNPYYPELEKLLAAKHGLDPEQVFVSAASNTLICTLLDLLARRVSGKVIIAQPSFPLYEEWCRSHGVRYNVWAADTDLTLDAKTMPAVSENALLIFASPNNPSGAAWDRQNFAEWLEAHPRCLVIADEAYAEFHDESYEALLARFPNLILLRTFSKTSAAAALRSGYVLAHPSLIELIRRSTLPYMLNIFASTALQELLSSPASQSWLAAEVAKIRQERDRLFPLLSSIGSHSGFKVFPSSANFFLLQWKSEEAALQAYHGLIRAGILVRNVGGNLPQLRGCLRVGIGISEANAALLQQLKGGAAGK